MIAETTYKLIRKLAADGCWYDTEIAEMAGVCTKTVRKYKKALLKEAKTKSAKPNPGRLIPPNTKTEPVWCDVCRTKVYPPCYACQLRARGITGQRSGQPDASLALHEAVVESEGYQRIRAVLEDEGEDIAEKHRHLVALEIRRNNST